VRHTDFDTFEFANSIPGFFAHDRRPYTNIHVTSRKVAESLSEPYVLASAR
jgi:hypothetical protein